MNQQPKSQANPSSQNLQGAHEMPQRSQRQQEQDQYGIGTQADQRDDDLLSPNAQSDDGFGQTDDDMQSHEDDEQSGNSQSGRQSRKAASNSSQDDDSLPHTPSRSSGARR
jgi:hypothetical protein